VPHRAEGSQLELRLLRDDSAELRELFEAAGEATHEAILNSLCAAGPMEGRDGRRVSALPYGLLPAALGVRRVS
jgi:D-aminopeptidase